jgi:hypothetical protein
VADWTTISALATAGGTLVLAGATFASVRSGSRAARTAERTLLAGLRPLLVPSRLDDAPQNVLYGDLEGGQRIVTRFALLPRQDGAWATSVGRYWNIDGADPR